MAANVELHKLIEKAKSAHGSAQAILDTAAEQKRDASALTAEEIKKIDLFMAEYDETKAAIDRVGRVYQESRVVEAGFDLDDPVIRKSALGIELKRLDPIEEAKARYNEVFRKALHQTKDRRLHEFLSPEERKTLSSLVAIDGGLAISEDMRTQMIKKLDDRVFVRGYATVITTNKAQVGFPGWDYDEEGFDSTLEGETGTPISITDILGKSVFTPHKDALIFKVPEELIEDADFDITRLLVDHFISRMAMRQERKFLTGNGVAEPYGILTAPITGVDVIGTTTVIAPEDVVGLPYEIRAVYRANGSYMMHRKAVKAIRLLRTNEQGAGTGAMLWQPSFQAGQPATLNGYPLAESEFFPDAYASGGADGDPLMLFGDWSHYWIVDRKTLSISALLEKYIDAGQIGQRLVARYDGAPIMLEPFVRLNRK
jgi:HK97 family phage major capsid protein